MAELRYTYLLDVKDMASRQVAQANARVTKSVEQTNLAMRQQGSVAESASRKIQTAGARQAAEWKQVQRAALAAERSVAQAATQASATVTRATEKQVAAQRAAGQSYQQIARQQKAAGVSARQTAAAIEQASVRERRAMEGTAVASKKAGATAAGGLKSKIADVKGLAGGLVAGFAAFKGLSFLEDAVNETEKLAKATARLSGLTGQDAKTASEWVVIAKERGVSAQQLNRSFITLERNQTRGAQGVKISAEAFKQLGISQQSLKRLNTEQLIERVADAFKQLGPGAQRATIAQQLFGRGAQGLVNVLGKGGAGVRALRREIDASGASMDRNGVRKALALAQAQRKLDAQFLGLKLTIGQAIIPYLTRGARALSTFIDQMRKGTGTGGQVRKVLEQVGNGVGQLARALAPAARGLATLFGPAAKVAGTAIGGMTQIIKSVVGVVRGMVGVVSNLLKGNFAGAWRSVKKIVSSALSGLGGLVKTLMAPVYTAVSGVVGRALKALGGLGSGIVGVLRGAVGSVGKAASAIAGAVLGAFRTLSRLISGVWNGIVGTIRGAVSTIKGAVGGITSLPSKVLNAINPFGGRTGGIASAGGFRRYQQGGLVPAMLSPGEMVVHGGAGMMVPGQRAPVDNVPMLLPAGSAVLTGHGQQLMAQGASVAQAVASQAPHFATGGWVRTGATVFDDGGKGAFSMGLAGGYAELGTAVGNTATGKGYIARLLGRKGELPRGFPLEVKIHGRSKVLRKKDRGYGQGTSAYSIDIWRDSWPFFGIDSSFKGPALVRPAGADGARPGGGGGGGGGGSVSYSPRGRLITSGRAAQLGYAAGLEGGSLYGVYGSVRDALTYNRTVTPGRGGGGGAGGAGGGGGARGGGSGGAGVNVGGRVHGHPELRPGVSALAATILRTFPSLRITSTTGGQHAAGSYHYRGRAVDLAGSGMNAAAGWIRQRLGGQLTEGIHNPNLSVKYGKRVGPGFWGSATWAGHRDHIHIAKRRGGWIGHYQRGGYPSGRPTGVAPSQRLGVPAGVPVDRLARPDAHLQVYLESIQRIKQAQAALLRAGAHDNAAIATALHALDRGLQDVGHISYARLVKMAANLRRAIAGEKDPDVARRLKGELRLVFGEMGRRIGLLAKQATDMVDSTVRASVHVERILKASKGKIDMTSASQLSSLERASTVTEATVRAAIGKLQEAYRRAAKAGLKGAMKTLAGKIAELMGTLVGLINDAKQAFADGIQAISDNGRTAIDQMARRAMAGLQIAGIDPSSPAGLGTQIGVAQGNLGWLQGQQATGQSMLAYAQSHGDAAAVIRITQQLGEIGTQIVEAQGTIADLGRQQVQAVKDERQKAIDDAAQAAQDAKDARDAQRQATIDAAAGAVSLAQGGLQGLGLRQQLAGTYDMGGQARSDYITHNIVPAIQAEIETLRRNGASATDVQQAQNDLLQAQLDAQDAIKGNTADTADALKNLGGTLGFEFQGARLTDDLLASGVGA